MWYWTIRALSIFLLKIFFRFRVEGIENLPTKTNFIVAANHASFLDPFLMTAAIPQKVYLLARRDIYMVPLIRWLADKTGVLPAGNASEKLLHLINKNKNVGLFPEGTRTRDGQIKDFRRGAALLALKTGRPIVPCAILGAYEAYPRTAKFPKFIPVTVKIGKPQYLLKELEDTISDISLQEGNFKIKNAIEEMMHAG